jgi:hypothetical protein
LLFKIDSLQKLPKKGIVGKKLDMKKKLFGVSIFFLICCPSYAQTFTSESKVASIGLGLGGSFGSYLVTSQTPAISVQYEQGIWPISDIGTISLGAYLGTKSYKYSTINYSQSWNYYIVGLRSAFHYSGFDIENFDLYAGLMLGYNHLVYRYNGPYIGPQSGTYGSSVGLSGYIGGRYYFTPKFGAFAELGFGISYATVGLAINL